jgi:hypothetical protein
MYIGILIFILVGVGLIVWGLKLTNAEHKEEDYIGSTAYGGTGFVKRGYSFIDKSYFQKEV